MELLAKINNVQGKLGDGINYKLITDSFTLSSGSLVVETGMTSVDFAIAGYNGGTVDATTFALKCTVADSSVTAGTKKITILGTGALTGYILYGGTPKI